MKMMTDAGTHPSPPPPSPSPHPLLHKCPRSLLLLLIRCCCCCYYDGLPAEGLPSAKILLLTLTWCHGVAAASLVWRLSLLPSLVRRGCSSSSSTTAARGRRHDQKAPPSLPPSMMAGWTKASHLPPAFVPAASLARSLARSLGRWFFSLAACCAAAHTTRACL